MKTYTYNPDLSNVNVLKTQKEQNDNFWISGHPDFLIPDFNEELEDIWTSFMTWYEREILDGNEIYDQNGGEVVESKITDSNTGLTACKYVAEIQPFEVDGKDYEFKECDVYVEGYVVQKNERTYFAATKVIIYD